MAANESSLTPKTSGANNLMKDNPYAGYGNIAIGDRFVGRESEIERLQKRLLPGAGSVSVIGEPRIGKSSLVKEAIRRSERESLAAHPIVWINLATIPSGSLLLNGIVEDTLQFLQDGDTPLPSGLESILDSKSDTTYDAFRRCNRLFKRLMKSNIQTLLVIDEFDAVRQYDDASNVIQSLRELIYHQYATGLSAIFISRRSLLALELQVGDVSTLNGVCEQQYLGPFDENSVKAMAHRCSPFWLLADTELELLNSITGGHPFLTEMLLCSSFPNTSIEEGFKIIAADFFDYYEHLQQLLREDGLFEQLVQITVGPTWSVNIGSVDRLLRYGLIKSTSSNQNQLERLVAWSDHFQSYLEKCSRDIPIWPLWHETEKCIRSFIENICSEAYGENWLNMLKARHKSVSETIDECEKRLELEKKKFPLAGMQYILYYTYPMDLWQIISAEWQIFSPKLKHDKNYWAQRFQHLAKIRTPTAHIREYVIPEQDVMLAQAMCKELIDLTNQISTAQVS